MTETSKPNFLPFLWSCLIWWPSGGIVSRINDNMLAKYPGSVGLLMPNMTGRIVDEDGRDVPVGEVGELWVRGPNIVKYD